jgi:hypothetical protein
MANHYIELVDLDAIISNYDFNLAYARELVADLTEDEMTEIPAEGLVNHPAFTLGHLVSGAAITAQDLGLEPDMPEGWKELFQRRGPGDERLPDEDRRVYPGKAELLSELERQHSRVKEALRQFSEEQLHRSFPWRFSVYMPTLLDLVTFLCISHEAMHLGQLAAWRRAMGKESALARL